MSLDAQSLLRTLEERLKPGEVRSKLIRASLVMTSWEILKSDIVDRIVGFFAREWDGLEPRKSDEYRQDVLSRHKDPLEASILWLIEVEALNQGHADKIKELRRYRNKIAHELPRFIVDIGLEIDVSKIREMQEIVAVVGRYWSRIQMQINPVFDEKTIADADIKSGTMVVLDLIVAVLEE